MAENGKNPRNSDNILFKRLTKLFSGPIVNRRSQTGRRLRRRDLDKYSTKFKSLAGKSFKKASYSPFENLQSNVMSNQQRNERYVDFDQMEYTPEIASALDIYADEMTTSSRLHPMVSIECPNEEIKAILHSLFYNTLNIEFNLFGWCRSLCKYGDIFLYLDIDEDLGIQSAIGLPTQEIERLEGEDKTNPNYVQYQWNSGGLTFENWQVAHFRVLGNDKYAPYGSSVLEPARRIWRQLTLLEDAMMAYRIVRSPERRVFYVDVGSISPEDVEQYMQKVMTQMKRHQIVDPDTGRVDLRYNPMSVDEDYFIPVRGNISTKIETLAGGQYTGDIDDVKYLRDKLFSALKVPQSYLARGEGSEEDKTTLAQKDIRFARTIQRLQRSIITELEKMAIIHLYIMGFRGDDLVSFKLSLNNSSKIAELQELEHWKSKFDVAGAATEGFFSRRWIAKKLFGISDDELLRNQRELYTDRKFDALLEGVGEAIQAEMGVAGDALGDEGLGDDTAMDLGTDTPDTGALGAETAPEDVTASETEDAGIANTNTAEPEEDQTLLASPGKRDDSTTYRLGDGSTTTTFSKGKRYTPVRSDKRKQAGRPKAMRSSGGLGVARATNTNLFPGAKELTSLARGVSESKNLSYREVEKSILEVSKDIKSVIAKLEEERTKDENQS